MTTTSILIRLEIKGKPEDAYAVVDTMLDNGCPQDEINEHEHPDCGPLHVVSAVVELDNDDGSCPTCASLSPWRCGCTDTPWQREAQPEHGPQCKHKRCFKSYVDHGTTECLRRSPT